MSAITALLAAITALLATPPGDAFEARLESIYIPTGALTWAEYSNLPYVVRRWCNQSEEGLAPFFAQAVALADSDPVAGYDMVLDIEAMLADLRERWFGHATYVARTAAREACVKALARDMLRDPIDERALRHAAGRGSVARGGARGTYVPRFSKAMAARHTRRQGRRLERFLLAA